MAQVILIKRGKASNIDSANLREGELALGFSQDNSTVVLYVGNGTATPIQVNAGVIASALAEAKTYADTQIANLIGGAPEAYDTLKEISQYISTHESEYDALVALVAGKIAKPEVDGTAGQVLKIGVDGKPYWGEDNDTTYGNATTSTPGLMSSDDKTKLDGVEAGAQVNTITGVKGDNESTYRDGNVNISKSNIGLGNVDNTADADKPISTATQAALDDKMDVDALIDGGTF